MNLFLCWGLRELTQTTSYPVFVVFARFNLLNCMMRSNIYPCMLCQLVGQRPPFNLTLITLRVICIQLCASLTLSQPVFVVLSDYISVICFQFGASLTLSHPVFVVLSDYIKCYLFLVQCLTEIVSSCCCGPLRLHVRQTKGKYVYMYCRVDTLLIIFTFLSINLFTRHING